MPKTPGSGRVKGTPNKSTAEVKALASQYSEEALRVLASIMRNTYADERARIAAAKELLDRAHGKPPQAITGADGGDLALHIKKIVHEHHPS